MTPTDHHCPQRTPWPPPPTTNVDHPQRPPHAATHQAQGSNATSPTKRAPARSRRCENASSDGDDVPRHHRPVVLGHAGEYNLTLPIPPPTSFNLGATSLSVSDVAANRTTTATDPATYHHHATATTADDVPPRCDHNHATERRTTTPSSFVVGHAPKRTPMTTRHTTDCQHPRNITDGDDSR